MTVSKVYLIEALVYEGIIVTLISLLIFQWNRQRSLVNPNKLKMWWISISICIAFIHMIRGIDAFGTHGIFQVQVGRILQYQALWVSIWAASYGMGLFVESSYQAIMEEVPRFIWWYTHISPVVAFILANLSLGLMFPLNREWPASFTVFAVSLFCAYTIFIMTKSTRTLQVIVTDITVSLEEKETTKSKAKRYKKVLSRLRNAMWTLNIIVSLLFLHQSYTGVMRLVNFSDKMFVADPNTFATDQIFIALSGWTQLFPLWFYLYYGWTSHEELTAGVAKTSSEDSVTSNSSP